VTYPFGTATGDLPVRVHEVCDRATAKQERALFRILEDEVFDAVYSLPPWRALSVVEMLRRHREPGKLDPGAHAEMVSALVRRPVTTRAADRAAKLEWLLVKMVKLIHLFRTGHELHRAQFRVGALHHPERVHLPEVFRWEYMTYAWAGVEGDRLSAFWLLWFGKGVSFWVATSSSRRRLPGFRAMPWAELLATQEAVAPTAE